MAGDGQINFAGIALLLPLAVSISTKDVSCKMKLTIACQNNQLSTNQETEKPLFKQKWVFFGCTVLPDSKETELGSSN